MSGDKNHQDTLCWSCANAVPNNEGRGCSWSRNFVPVEGWTAEPRTISGSVRYSRTETYCVIDCPEFSPDRPNKVTNGIPVPVRCVETGVVYQSMTVAARAIGHPNSQTCITDAIRTGGIAFGYHWERA